MLSVSEVIVVEGRYDKNTILQTVDATVIETGGFGIFNDREKRELLRRLALRRGLIVFTDPDGAGLVIRNYINGCVEPGLVKHAYIPEISGRERRKSKSSKEGLLGVEGMRPEQIIAALRRAGATFDGKPAAPRGKIGKADLYRLGLTGGEGSAERRGALKQRLGLPQKMSTDALLQVINALYERDEFFELFSDAGKSDT